MWSRTDCFWGKTSSLQLWGMAYLVVCTAGSTFHRRTPVAVPAARRVLQWGLWRVEDCHEEVWKWRGGDRGLTPTGCMLERLASYLSVSPYDLGCVWECECVGV